MAHFNYRSQFSFSFSAKPVVLRARVSFGASGAPTLVSGTGMGITSIARTGAGAYTITLDRKFADLMMLNRTPIAASAPAAPIMRIAANDVSVDGTIDIVFSIEDGTATDPASGESVLLEVVLNDSSLSY